MPSRKANSKSPQRGVALQRLVSRDSYQVEEVQAWMASALMHAELAKAFHEELNRHLSPFRELRDTIRAWWTTPVLMSWEKAAAAANDQPTNPAESK